MNECENCPNWKVYPFNGLHQCKGNLCEKEVREDAIKKFAEWMYKSQYHGPDVDLEERKNYTISRWIEDFEREQRNE